MWSGYRWNVGWVTAEEKDLPTSFEFSNKLVKVGGLTCLTIRLIVFMSPSEFFGVGLWVSLVRPLCLIQILFPPHPVTCPDELCGSDLVEGGACTTVWVSLSCLHDTSHLQTHKHTYSYTQWENTLKTEHQTSDTSNLNALILQISADIDTQTGTRVLWRDYNQTGFNWLFMCKPFSRWLWNHQFCYVWRCVLLCPIWVCVVVWIWTHWVRWWTLWSWPVHPGSGPGVGRGGLIEWRCGLHRSKGQVQWRAG